MNYLGSSQADSMPAAPRQHATASSNAETAGELGKLLVDALNEATRIADQIDGGPGVGPRDGSAKDPHVRPVPTGFMEQHAEQLRDCITVTRAIRAQLERLGSRL